MKILGSDPKNGLSGPELTPEAIDLRKARHVPVVALLPLLTSHADMVPTSTRRPRSASSMNCGSRRCRTRSSYVKHVCCRGTAYAKQIILAIAAAVSIVLGLSFPPPGEEQSGWIEGVAIIIAILAVTLYATDRTLCAYIPNSVSSINNWAKERKFRELTEESRKDVQINVVRNGVVAPLSAYHILVGDVIELNTGNGVPGDGLYIFGTTIPLTCASHPRLQVVISSLTSLP